jgi:hypothetical protein
MSSDFDGLSLPPLPPGEARAVSDADYCQFLRRFPPSKFIPELCSVSAELELGEWQGRMEGRLVTSWALADMARVSLAHGNEHRRTPPTRNDVLRGASAFNALDDPDVRLGRSDWFERFFLRIASQQLDYQFTPRHEMKRMFALCDTPVVKPLEVMTPGWDLDLLGCSLSEYMAVGEFLLYSHKPNKGRFSTAFFEHPEVIDLLSLPTAAVAADIYRRNFAQDVAQFREAVRLNNRPAPYRHLTYNPLLNQPAITGLGPMDYVPVASLVIRKLSPTGLYYSGVNHFGSAFARDMGTLFEQYVGRNLRLSTGATAYPEVPYGPKKERRYSVDWIVVTQSAVVLVEVKSVRPTEPVRVGRLSAADDLKGMLQKACNQIDETSAAIQERRLEFRHIPTDRPLVGVVATLGDFHVPNAAPIRTYVGIDPATPTVIASIADIEHLVVGTEDIGRFILDVATDDPANGNSLRSAFGTLLQTENPILEDAWKSSGIH